MDWIALYAAVVATATLIWQFVARRRDRRPKLTVSLDVIFQTLNYERALEYGRLRMAGEETTWPGETVLEVRAVNVGREAVTVTRLDIEIDVPTTGSGHVFSSDADFPRRLERGELFGYAIEVSPNAFRPDSSVDASAQVSTGEVFRAGARSIHQGALMTLPAEPFEEMLDDRELWRHVRIYRAIDVSNTEED